MGQEQTTSGLKPRSGGPIGTVVAVLFGTDVLAPGPEWIEIHADGRWRTRAPHND